MSRRLRAPVRSPRREQLDGDLTLEEPRHADVPNAFRRPGAGSDADVGEERLDFELRNPAARPRRRISNEHERPPICLADSRCHRVVADEIEDRVVPNAGRLRHRVVDPRVHRAGDLVDRAPA
jgi:hypothetical protein